jgi:heme-degrading monooxygenase HmoA
MITVGMNYNVIPGKETLFEDKFSSVIGALKTATGHTESSLYKDVSKAQSYLIISQWSDQEAFTTFIHSDDFRAVTDWGKEEILAGRPAHKIYKH